MLESVVRSPRRRGAALGALAWMALAGQALQAQEDGPVTREEHRRVLDEIEKLRAELAALKDLQDGAERRAGEPAEVSSGTGGIFDKPYLGRVTPQAYVGGYFDVEFRDAERADHEFRLHRFVPSIYADIHERIRFASEIEIEDGSEVEIEFAFIDLRLDELVNVRGGVILDPLGKFNLIHDSPINDLTDRPLVDQLVIPTTLREIGVGLFGAWTAPVTEWELKYEAYLTSGFKGLSNDPLEAPAIDTANGLRAARASEETFGTRHLDDNNNAFAGVGRISVSPRLGSELGLSAHHGAYDEEGENDLTIGAVDGLIAIPQFEVLEVPIGPIELQGEGAYAWIERGDFARAQGVPGDFWGYYAQANYHFMPSYLVRNLGAVFLPESTFTFVGRWDHVDLDDGSRYRITTGLNFRPVEATVIKFDYQFNWGSGSAPGSADDDAFLVSLASYF